MMYLGDFFEDEVVRFLWSTFSAQGDSLARSSDGTVKVYKDGGTTESTAGVTDTKNFDATTGLNLCTIDTSTDAFYAAGADYAVVLVGAIIDGKSVTAVLAHFSVAKRGTKGLDGAKVTKAAKALLNKRDQTIATGVTKLYDDDGTTVIQTETPSESGGVLTITPS